MSAEWSLKDRYILLVSLLATNKLPSITDKARKVHAEALVIPDGGRLNLTATEKERKAAGQVAYPIRIRSIRNWMAEFLPRWRA